MLDDDDVPPAVVPVGFQHPPYTIHIVATDGRQATIDWSDGIVKFSGDLPVDDAAKQFFEAVAGYAAAAQKVRE